MTALFSPQSAALQPKIAALRVALLTDSDVFAGTERHILDLAIGLRELGASVTISAPAASLLLRRDAPQNLRLPIEKGGFLDLRAIQILHHALRRGEFEVLHAHNGRTHLSAALATTLARRGACVFTQHFIEPRHLRGKKSAARRAVHRWVGARTQAFIAISGAVRAAMLARGEASAQRLEQVFNGIGDPLEPSLEAALEPREVVRHRYGIAVEAPLLVCVARLAKEKDHPTLLTAFAEVKAQFPDARLLLAGDGAQKAALQGQVSALGLASSVQVLGFVEGALSLARAADIVVLPAPREPFGLVFLEAMALAKPVVACQGGAAPEIVRHQETGILVAPHAPREMGAALSYLVENPSRAQQLGEAGRARFLAHFTRGSMATRTLEVYRHALQSGGAA